MYFQRKYYKYNNKTVELSHTWVLINFKYQETELYSILFDELEEGPFEIPPGRTKVGVIIKPVPSAPNFYFYRIQRELACYVHCHVNFYLLVIKLLHIILNMRFYPRLKK